LELCHNRVAILASRGPRFLRKS